MAKKIKLENQENQKDLTESNENKELQDIANEVQAENTEQTTIENSETKPICEQERLEQELSESQKKYDELNDRYLRLNADFDNFRKRTLKDKMELVKNGGADVLQGFLPTLDDIERSMKYIAESSEIDALREGVEIIYNSLREFLRQRGIEEIEAINQTFDTTFHEAISQMPSQNDEMKGKVIDVIQKGYKLNGNILRIAKVVVAQ